MTPTPSPVPELQVQLLNCTVICQPEDTNQLMKYDIKSVSHNNCILTASGSQFWPVIAEDAV